MRKRETINTLWKGNQKMPLKHSLLANLFILPFILLAPAPSALAQGNDIAYPELELKLSEVSTHLRFLAADELMGRMTGEQGNAVAARYIAEQFRSYGLSPLPNTASYLQEIPLVKITHSKDNFVVIGDDTLKQSREMLVMSGQEINFSAPLVFVDQNDFREKDLAGKIAVTKFGDSERSGVRSGFQLGKEKRNIAAERGALALVEIYSARMPWNYLAYFLEKPQYEIADTEKAISEDAIPHILINDPGKKFVPETFEKQDFTASIRIKETKTESFKSANVIGHIEGSDPEFRMRFVLLGAHYDHVGAGVRPGATPADTIFNGARDNGMGVVALLSAAKALSETPPARSVICIAFTGEEVGLLGSEYYVEHPVVSLNNTVFVLNSDGAGYTDTTLVTVLGLERTTAQSEIKSSVKVIGLSAIQDPVPEMQLFNASDNVHFAQKGIPTVTFSPGFREFDDEIRRYFHQPADEADENFDFSYLLRFSQAYAHCARMIANMSEQPRWEKGDEYEAASQALYGEK